MIESREACALSKTHSPEPWEVDRHDAKAILDAEERLVAVTTSREDARRIVAGVNAAAGSPEPGLAAGALFEAAQVLFEICLYNEDMKFRNHVDRHGGFKRLLARADKAWRAFGEDVFHAEGASREASEEEAAAPATPPPAAAEK